MSVKFLGVAILLIGLTALLVPSNPVGAASGPQGWSGAQAPLPNNSNSDPNLTILSTSCTSATSCTAVGTYNDTAGYQYGAIETLSGGTWSATAAPEPANTGTDADTHQLAFLNAVTCVSATSCIAVGSYDDTAGYQYGLIETLSGGTWSAIAAPEPANTGTDADTHQAAFLNAVSCASATSCTAVGSYQDTGGYQYSLIETLSGGTWSPTGPPEPANTGTDADFHQAAYLDAVSCPSSTSCTAVGHYDDTAGYGNGLIETLSGGSWSATAAPEPANAGTDADTHQFALLHAVSCVSASSCIAFGTYSDSANYNYALIDTLSGGTWSATAAPEPANAGTDANTKQNATLHAVSCASATSCTAVGNYEDTAGYIYGLIDTLSGGTWSATAASEPANTGTDADTHQSAGLDSVSCASATSCTAVGNYQDTAGYEFGLIETLSVGTWSGIAAPEPANAGTDANTDQFAYLNAVSCSSPVTCLVGGTYTDASTLDQGLFDFLTGGDTSIRVQGYWLVASDGGIFTFGGANFYGSTGSMVLNKPIVGMAATPDGKGYRLVASDGGIFTFGGANFYGSTGSMVLNKPIVGMAATPDGKGYWLVASDGGIFTFGSASYYGSTGAIALSKPIVGIAATPDGKGYWLVASDGGIFTFGSANYYGSTGATALSNPIVGIAATPDGKGYWLVASDGGIFTEGDAQFYGSTGAIALNKPIVGMAPTPDGKGYWLVASDGGIFTKGDAQFYGSVPGVLQPHQVLNGPIVGMATGA